MMNSPKGSLKQHIREENKENCSTPIGAISRELKRQSHSGNFSDVRKLFECFERPTKILPQQMLKEMNRSIEEHSKRVRK
jgi:hypothetical protein